MLVRGTAAWVGLGCSDLDGDADGTKETPFALWMTQEVRRKRYSHAKLVVVDARYHVWDGDEQRMLVSSRPLFLLVPCRF